MRILPFAPRVMAGFAAAILLVGATLHVAADPAPGPLVSTQWLKGKLGDLDLVVVDVRSALDGGGKEAYLKGHIPGAVHSDYDKAGWRVTRNNVPFMVPTVAELEKIIGELGIDEDSYVVIVPAGVHATDFGAAARVYWTLKFVGHDKVSILDGGFRAWQSESGNAIETGARPASPKIFTAALNKRILAEAADVEASVRAGDAALVDARSPQFFSGKEKWDRLPIYGHIPGAVNVDSAALYDSTRDRLKAKHELAAVFADLPPGRAISYCNTGHWAATNWFVLSELLGRKDAKLYAGSMVEWVADARRPVESSRTKWDDIKKIFGLGS